MRNMIGILGGMVIVVLALVIYYEITQPDYPDIKATWYGGLPGDQRKIENKTLDQISTLAGELAAIYAEPVHFKSENGRIIYEAYNQGYDKSNCVNIQEKAWQRGKLVINEAKKICGLLKDTLWGGFPGDLPMAGYQRGL